VKQPDKRAPRPTGERNRSPGIRDAFTAGFTLVLTVLLFLAAGAWVDHKLGTSPILSLLGAGVGAAAAIYRIVRQARIPPRRDTDRR